MLIDEINFIKNQYYGNFCIFNLLIQKKQTI